MRRIILLLISANLYAASFSFLKIDPDPASIASQSASIAVVPPYFAKNPAHYATYKLSLRRHKRRRKYYKVLRINSSIGNWLVGSNIGTFNGFYNFKNYIFGLNIFYLNYGKFEIRDTMGEVTGNFTANAGIISPVVAYYSRNFAIGGRLGYAYERIYDANAFTVFIDLGGVFLTRIEKYKYTILYHMCLRNLGTKVRYERESAFIPVELLLGACAYRTRRLIYSVNLLLRDDPNLSFGIDYRVHKLVNLRASYVIGQDLGFLSGIRIGLRLRYKKYPSIDYVIYPMGPFGIKHILGINYSYRM